MLPFSRNGLVPLPPQAGTDPELILDRLAAALAELRPRSVQREPGAVTFEGGLFRFVSNWNLLVPLAWGRVAVGRRDGGLEARYRLAFTELVAITTALVGLVAIPIVLVPGPDAGAVRFVVPVVMWAWLVGANVALTLVRFPAFVRRVAVRIGPPDADPGAAPDPTGM